MSVVWPVSVDPEQVPAAAAGSVVVITGASRGLGAGMAARMATLGVRLALCSRSEPPEPDVGGSEHGEVHRARVDVTDASAVDRFAAAVVERFGRIDCWINNAGLLEPISPLAQADPGAVAALVSVNLLGVLHGSATFARHVRERSGPGVLLNMSSGAAHHPYVGWAPYCASKAAVDMASEVLAREEVGSGLRVHACSPGLVDTDMQAAIRATPPERFPAVERFLDAADRGDFNRAEWVADALLALAFADPPPLEVVVRIPDDPVRGTDPGSSARVGRADEG
jgi:benzil reductase ((S)-benzoin forming)